jgi:biotin carboxyl carrier protein
MSIYRVNIEGHVFEVEIEDLHARPIIAIVDGIPVEVWPENHGSQQVYPASPTANPAGSPPAPKQTEANTKTKALGVSPRNGEDGTVKAPIPGSVLSISVRSGDQVQVGQELCVIEAMKMKNTIRAGRSGTIAQVKVVPGQTVHHHDLLMEYE